VAERVRTISAAEAEAEPAGKEGSDRDMIGDASKDFGLADTLVLADGESRWALTSEPRSRVVAMVTNKGRAIVMHFSYSLKFFFQELAGTWGRASSQPCGQLCTHHEEALSTELIAL